MKNKAFTLVEMLVALAVGAIVIMATYASYEMVNTQYHKNIDTANMHTSGRAIMQMIERDVRMAGFEYRHTSGANKGEKAFSSSIATPLDITDSGNKCCDQVKVIYDYFNEDTKVVKRIQIHYFTEGPITTKKNGMRYRLYKQTNDVLPTPKTGLKEVLADYVEDLQLVNIVREAEIFVGSPRRSVMSVIADNKLKKQHVNVSRTNSLAFGPNGNLYSGHSSGKTISVSAPDNPAWGLYLINTDPVNSLAFGPDGMLYVGHFGSPQADKISVFNPLTGVLIRTINLNLVATTSSTVVAFSPSGQLYVGRVQLSQGIWGYIEIYNPITGVFLDSFKRYPSKGENAMAFDASGNLYTSKGAYHNGVYMYNPSISGNRRFVKKVNNAAGPWIIAINDNMLYYSQGSGLNKQNLDDGNSSHISAKLSHIEAIAINNKTIGKESLVTIHLTLRGKNQYGKDRQFKKKDYFTGNYKLDKTDKYKRDTFSTTVLVRNLAL